MWLCGDDVVDVAVLAVGEKPSTCPNLPHAWCTVVVATWLYRIGFEDICWSCWMCPNLMYSLFFFSTWVRVRETNGFFCRLFFFFLTRAVVKAFFFFFWLDEIRENGLVMADVTEPLLQYVLHGSARVHADGWWCL